MPIVTALIGTPARPRLRPGALDPHARTALGRAAALLGGAAPAPTLAGARPEELEATLLETLDLVAVRASSGDAEAAGVLTDLHHALAGVRAQRAASAADGLVRVQQALSHLRGVDSLPAVLAKGAQELCRSCGFDRAIVFRLEGSHLVAEAIHFEGDDEGAREVLAYSRRHPAQLTHSMLETQMIRRRAPGLVLDARSDPRTHREMVEATDTRSYVAAPIMPAGQVIGFVHADRHTSARQVDAADRDLLWAFAEGFGYAVERTALGERLREQRDQVRQMSSSTEAILNELCDAPAELARSTVASLPLAHTAAAVFVAPESRIDALLTRREREVAALMAAGLTNGEIADRLVIAPGTVKSHVKRVLRKLRASNRAEAVARYLRATPPVPGDRRRSP